jgi:hypothetical protein
VNLLSIGTLASLTLVFIKSKRFRQGKLSSC